MVLECFPLPDFETWIPSIHPFGMTLYRGYSVIMKCCNKYGPMHNKLQVQESSHCARVEAMQGRDISWDAILYDWTSASTIGFLSSLLLLEALNPQCSEASQLGDSRTYSQQ